MGIEGRWRRWRSIASYVVVWKYKIWVAIFAVAVDAVVSVHSSSRFTLVFRLCCSHLVTRILLYMIFKCSKFKCYKVRTKLTRIDHPFDLQNKDAVRW